MQTPIYWTAMNFEEWKIHIASTARGLVFVGSLNKPFTELQDWVEKRYPKSTLIQDKGQLESYKLELTEYLNGERKNFSFPIDYQGTPFQQTVWKALCEIPYGEIRTYTDIAEQIKRPKSVRAVGTAIGANPILITIPCHRVIGKNGSLTGYRGGLDMKTKLLQLEKQYDLEVL